MSTDLLDSPAPRGSREVAERDVAFRHSDRNGVSELVVDLREVTRLDASTLLLCIAVIATRVRAAARTVLRLPRAHAGRDFLRAWDFQAAVETAGGISLRRLVAAEDRRFFGEAASHYLPHAAVAADGGLRGIVTRLEADRFFALGIYRLGETKMTMRMIQGEWSRWRRHLFLEGLGPHLRGPRDDVARVVIHELLANAAQHPGASVATVAATVTEDTPGDHWLVIAMWDDGTSIVDTLRACLRDGESLRATTAPIDEIFDVEPVGWESDRLPLTSSFRPDASCADGELLVASLIAGISRKPSQQAVEHVPRPEAGDWDDHVGYGLYALYRSVINDFGGELCVRTHGHELRLTAGDEPHCYRTRVEKYADEPEFAGNLITARLPIFS